MKNSRLVKLLRSFSLQEMKEFCDYVRSPFFNKNKNLIALSELLKDHHPDFKDSGLSDEYVSSRLFPDTGYDYFRIRNLTSDLLSLAKDFLAQIFYRDESVHYPTFLIEKLREKNQDNLTEQSFKIYTKQLEEQKIKDEFYLLRLSELSQQKHFYSITKDPLGSYKLFQDDFDNFLEYSLLRLLKFYCIMIHDKVQARLEFDMKMFDQILEYVKSTGTFKNPTLTIYARILRLVLERTKEHFFILKELREKYSENLTQEDRYMLDLYMSSFCADAYNVHATTEFQHEHFLISKGQFDRDEMSVGHFLYPDFIIHVKVATRVSEFEWAEKFMSRYAGKLAEDERQLCLDFCHGYMSFYKGQYEKALELLSRSNFSKNLLKTQVKILILQCYYELNFEDQFFDFAMSFRKFLDRDKEIAEDYRTSFQKYLRVAVELAKLKQLPRSRERISDVHRLLKEVNRDLSNLFGIRLWLREKLQELS